MPKLANPSLPWRRIYVDIPAKVATRLDQLAKNRGVSKKQFVADLLVREADRAARKDATAD